MEKTLTRDTAYVVRAPREPSDDAVRHNSSTATIPLSKGGSVHFIENDVFDAAIKAAMRTDKK